MNQVANVSLSRRGFLKATGITTGGLVVAASLKGCGSAPKPLPYSKDFQPNAFIQIDKESNITLFIPHSEMGQGVETGLTTLVAEELNTSPTLIQTKFAGNHAAYDVPEFGAQITGGSTSIKLRFEQLRQAAASIRELILQAAANQLAVPKSGLTFMDGVIVQASSEPKQRHNLADFVETAQVLPIPEDIVLKPASEFKWIGKPHSGKQDTLRKDTLAKVMGTAEFGIDVDIPDAKSAYVITCPVIGGTLKSFDGTAAKAMAGVHHVVPVYNGVAVVADTWWQAKTASTALKIDWNLTELANYSDDNLAQALDSGLASDDSVEATEIGAGLEGLDKAAKRIKARYKAPYLAHATMEPMNCVIKISGQNMEIWAPTQAPGLAAQIASDHSGISRENIAVHSTYLGGGFGRRVMHDYIGQATEIALLTGEIIKLVWSRETDTQNDYYRPISWADFEAGLDEKSQIDTWSVKRAGPNIMPYVLDEGLGMFLPEILPKGMVNWLGKRSFGVFENWTADSASVEGVHEDYDIANKAVQHVTVDPGLRTGFWRSVGHSWSGFFKESFVDELAIEAKEDPLAYRLQHMNHQPRLQNVLRVAAEKTGWSARSRGQGLGIAAHASFSSYVAQVAQVSVMGKTIKVEKVTCVMDCGLAINPDVVKAQMISGINFGLSAALHQQISLKDGAVQEGSFDSFPILRMNEAPEIDVVLIESAEQPTGVGEPGTPPIAAAVANAVFDLTGVRLRELPLKMA